MSVVLSPLGVGQQFFGGSSAFTGNTPLTAGLLYVYAAGTTTPATTYTSSSGTTANTNPIVLDANGRVPYEIWWTPGSSYKFVLTDALGNSVSNGTWDNVIGINDLSVSSSNAASGISYTPPGTGAVATTVGAELSIYRSLFDFCTAAQIADWQGGTYLNDFAPMLQAGVTACAGGMFYIPPGKGKILTAITILNTCKVFAHFGTATIALGTQNMNGFVVGNGTSAGQTSSIRSWIEGLIFIPYPGVPPFTSGACVFLDYCYYVRVINIQTYGNNGAANILYTGVNVFQATECWVTHSYFYYMLGYGIYGSGGSSSLRTVDCRFDFNEFASFIGLDCVHLDANCAGNTINFPIMYSYWNGLTGSNANWGINFNGGTSGTLNYVCQPDIEADGQSGGIYCQSGANIDIDGGWIGTSTFNGTNPSFWVGASCNSVKVTGMQILYGRVQIDGPACNFTGCDVVGDGVASTFGFVINSGATDTSITGGAVRQHPLGGIQYATTPPATRCKVVGVNFKAVGPTAGTGYEIVGSTGIPGSILGASGSPALLPPVARSCQSDVPLVYAAATTAKVVTSVGRDYYQVTASANITTITPLSLGNRITIQAGSGGITLTSGGNIQLKTAPTNIAAFATMSFVGDGQNWFEDGRNF